MLTAQQTLLNARVLLVTAQRDRVVASYAVLAAMGHLSASRLNLTAQLYDPTVHLDQVKNKLIGTSTPDGAIKPAIIDHGHSPRGARVARPCIA